MPEASKNRRTTFSFQDTPPEIAYLDPSFLLNSGLLPRDALHTAAVFETGIGAIITTDADFALVDGLQVYTCNPKALQMEQDTSAG